MTSRPLVAERDLIAAGWFDEPAPQAMPAISRAEFAGTGWFGTPASAPARPRRRRKVLAGVLSAAALVVAVFVVPMVVPAGPVEPAPSAAVALEAEPLAISPGVTVPDGPMWFDAADVTSTAPPPPEPEPEPAPQPHPQLPPNPAPSPPVSIGEPSPAPSTPAPSPSPVASAPTPTGAAPAGPGPITTIYMAPGGTGDGESPDDAVGSFARAQQRTAALDAGNVDIVLAAGTYRIGATHWWHPLDGHRLRILGPDSGTATFAGAGAGPYWLDISPRGGGGSVEVRDVTVSGYANGLRISGGYDNTSGSSVRTGRPINRPVVADVNFEQIGSEYSSAAPGYAAVHLQVTNGATVARTTFVRIENHAGRASYVHAVYAVASTNMAITGNTFTTVSGDPVRVRHSSSGSVSANTFSRAGRYAAVSDWFCDSACAARNSQARECPSATIVMSGNRIGPGYSGGQVPEWARTVAGGC